MNNHVPLPAGNGNYYINELNNHIREPIVESQKIDFYTPSEIYNAVFENSFHAVYIGNSDGYILRFNKKLCKVFGYSENEMNRFESFRLFNLYETAFIDFVNERKRKGIAKAEITCIKKSGKMFPCRISSVFYQSENGEKRTMNTLVDISESLDSRWDLAQ